MQIGGLRVGGLETSPPVLLLERGAVQFNPPFFLARGEGSKPPPPPPSRKRGGGGGLTLPLPFVGKEGAFLEKRAPLLEDVSKRIGRIGIDA